MGEQHPGQREQPGGVFPPNVSGTCHVSSGIRGCPSGTRVAIVSTESFHPGLHWSIKRSFVLYVARVADGQILGGPGVSMADASTFVWAPRPGTTGDVLDFEGAVVFGAHAGALSFRIADPQIQIGPERSVLSIAGEGADRIPFVDFAAVMDAGADSGAWIGTDVRLLESALPLFAGYYGAGEPFDDLHFAA